MADTKDSALTNAAPIGTDLFAYVKDPGGTPLDRNATFAQVLAYVEANLTTLVAKALFNANTILAANSDDTPSALTVGEETMVGRITGGNIAALTQGQILGLIGKMTDVTTSGDYSWNVAANPCLNVTLGADDAVNPTSGLTDDTAFMLLIDVAGFTFDPSSANWRWVGGAPTAEDMPGTGKLLIISGVVAGSKCLAMWSVEDQVPLTGRQTSSSALPTTTEYPTDGDWGVHTNTSDSKQYFVSNHGGTIKGVELVALA